MNDYAKKILYYFNKRNKKPLGVYKAILLLFYLELLYITIENKNFLYKEWFIYHDNINIRPNIKIESLACYTLYPPTPQYENLTNIEEEYLEAIYILFNDMSTFSLVSLLKNIIPAQTKTGEALDKKACAKAFAHLLKREEEKL